MLHRAAEAASDHLGCIGQATEHAWMGVEPASLRPSSQTSKNGGKAPRETLAGPRSLDRIQIWVLAPGESENRPR